MNRVLDALRRAAQAEKAQTQFYRRLAAAMAERQDLAERINGLLADEQHHLSRLVARLLELGVHAEVEPEPLPAVTAGDWETVAREREHGEIAMYEQLLAIELDSRTRVMIEEFLDAERRHAEELGGKWMGA